MKQKIKNVREGLRPHFSKILLVLMLAMFGVYSFAPTAAGVGATEASNPLVCVSPGVDDISGDPCLLLDGTTLTEGLFSGANVIIVALGAIMFLLAGFMLGGNILTSVVGIISRFKFGM